MKALEKQPSHFNLSGFNCLYENLLLINPNGKAYEETVKGKEEFSKNYEISRTRISRPHITLVNYLQPDLFETGIISALREVTAISNQIRVVLKNYGWFEGVVFYDVEHKIDIKQLVRKISKYIKRFMIREKDPDIRKRISPRFISNPHVTLCKGLSPEELQRTKAEYTSKKFYTEFVADEIILLKRLGANPYQVVGRFKLNGPAILTIIRQGNLFQ